MSSSLIKNIMYPKTNPKDTTNSGSSEYTTAPYVILNAAIGIRIVFSNGDHT